MGHKTKEFDSGVNSNKKKLFQRHLIYALISLASPFISLGTVLLYQSYAYDWFWQITEKAALLDDADINAGAMMGVVIVIQLVFALGIGSLLGLVFAVMSLKRNPKIISFGMISLLFNLIPFVGSLLIIIRGYLIGF